MTQCGHIHDAPQPDPFQSPTEVIEGEVSEDAIQAEVERQNSETPVEAPTPPAPEQLVLTLDASTIRALRDTFTAVADGKHVTFVVK